MMVRSVFRFGIVQVRVTWLPDRVAERSPTGSGKFSDGGCGAPGVPHPGKNMSKLSASANQPCRGSKTIGVSLMETVAVSVYARVFLELPVSDQRRNANCNSQGQDDANLHPILSFGERSEGNESDIHYKVHTSDK